MPDLRTELTEIVTGLGMLCDHSIDVALAAPPPQMLNVTTDTLKRLTKARASRDYPKLFNDAWINGRIFAESPDGLRGRTPLRVEWKGTHKSPGNKQIPSDLRIDYVYLVSCKYMSNILYNSSPANLFDRLLITRHRASKSWYLEVAPTEYQNLYAACRNYLGPNTFSSSVKNLSVQDRGQMKTALARNWPEPLIEHYHRLCRAVSRASTHRWQEAMGNQSSVREEMLWSLLRLQAAPYFVLGADSKSHPMRYRVDTPWDFRQRYAFRSFDLHPDVDAGQPTVRWNANLLDQRSSLQVQVEGHVEVRWSHGRFSSVEAKVYLDTPYEATPGYNKLRCS